MLSFRHHLALGIRLSGARFVLHVLHRGHPMGRSIQRLTYLLPVVVTVVAVAPMICDDARAAEPAQVNLTEWTPPDISSVGDDAFGKMVKYGYALMTDTANQIGPMVADPAKRYSGNNLTCQNCHLKAGAQPYAMPLVGVWGQFPQYRGREGEVAAWSAA
jgi:thiosulfate dehydrogenase